MDQRLEEAPGKSSFRSLSLVFLGETNMAVLPLELRWLHLVVAVSYQKINTPVAHQYPLGWFFLETCSLSPLAREATLRYFQERAIEAVHVCIERRVRIVRAEKEEEHHRES